jgi:hypothetical protein
MRMSKHLAQALYYCDPSGLDNKTHDIYNRIDFDFVVTDWSEDSSDINGRCHFTGLYDNCVRIQEVGE